MWRVALNGPKEQLLQVLGSSKCLALLAGLPTYEVTESLLACICNLSADPS